MSNEEETGYYIGFKMHKGCLKKNVLWYFVLFSKSFKIPSLRIKLKYFLQHNFLKLP